MGKSKKRSIDTHFWNDTYTGGLGRDEKYLYIYLITNPLTNMLGIYEIRQERMCFDTGLDEDTVRQALDRFEEDGKVKYVDGYIILVNFVKNQNYNRNMLKSAVANMKELPDAVKRTSFFRRILEWFREVPEGLEGVHDITIPNKQLDIEDVAEEEPEPDNTTPSRKPGLKSDTGQWRTQGATVPEPLRIDGFVDKFEEYCDELTNSGHKPMTSRRAEKKFIKLIRLKKQGHDPLDVIEQTMRDGNQAFYKLKDQEFESNNKSNGDGNKNRADKSIDTGKEIINKFSPENAN